MIIQQVLLGLLLLAIGVVSLKYNYQLVRMTGNVSWAEQYLGAGGTYAFFKIVSVVLCLIGFLYMTGLWGGVFGWLVSPLARFFPHATRT